MASERIRKDQAEQPLELKTPSLTEVSEPITPRSKTNSSLANAQSESSLAEPIPSKTTVRKRKKKVHTDKPKRKRTIKRRCNQLDGKKWLQNSISVWSDLRKSPEEASWKHPAMFPQNLIERLLETFLPNEGNLILDPFCGSGTTLLVAAMLNKQAVGLELSEEYREITLKRLEELNRAAESSEVVCHHARAQEVLDYVEPNSVDICITSPPYWNVLNQPRSADHKQTRHYGNLDGDLGTIDNYEDYLKALKRIFTDVYQALKPGAFCIVVVMDLRKRSQFFPLHSDLAQKMTKIGFIFDDLIIWNRQAEYNNLRPLGFPAVFRVNKVHEYILLFQKPKKQ